MTDETVAAELAAAGTFAEPPAVPTVDLTSPAPLAPVVAPSPETPPPEATVQASAAGEPALSPLKQVEAWWAELLASAPVRTEKAFEVHAAEQWHKLVARLEDL